MIYSDFVLASDQFRINIVFISHAYLSNMA